jgi:hypothetical protein
MARVLKFFYTAMTYICSVCTQDDLRRLSPGMRFTGVLATTLVIGLKVLNTVKGAG